MMKLNRREQTTRRDIHHRWLIRQGAGGQRVICAVCHERIQMITLAEAATATRVETQAILMLAETVRLHARKADGAVPLICLNLLINLRIDSEPPGED